MVLAVVGHLRAQRRARGRDLDRRAAGGELVRQPPVRVLELDQRAQRVEGHEPACGEAGCQCREAARHATQCHVAKIAEYAASPIVPSVRSTGPRQRRSDAQAATAMASGNSTSRKRGSDMSGWGTTG